MKVSYSIALLFLIITSPTILAQDTYDQIWDYATLYDNDTSAIKKLALSGRLQAESYAFDADEGDDSDSLWRRARLGFKMNLGQSWLVHIEGDFNLNNDSSDRYNRLTDAYIAWLGDDGTKIKILKQSAGFTLDGATSSKKLITLQRNNLTNNMWFTAEYFTGITAQGAIDDSSGYKIGVFSNDGNEEISNFDARYFGLASYNRDIANQLNIDKASMRIDYVYNQEDDNANTRDLSQVISLSSQLQHGDWHLWSDFTAGKGYAGQSDLWGLSVMPFFDINDTLQAVVRYTYLSSSDNNGIRLGRYEKESVAGRGDEYNELYTGLNVFFYGHKLKWQTGLQYTTMNDNANDGGEYTGWGVTTGLRLSW